MIHPSEIEPLKGNKEKVLVVDDQEPIREYLETMLVQCNYEVKQAKNGTEAGLFIINYKPDLILLDVNMPGINGKDIAQNTLNQPQLSHTKIIVLTGRYSKELENELQDMGVKTVLQKPIDAKDLLVAVKNELASDEAGESEDA